MRVDCLLLLALAALDTQKPVAVPAGQNRFLFIVETSQAMARSAPAARTIVSQLLETGAVGEMQRKDTIAVWTYNEEVFTSGLPLQQWDPDNPLPVVETVAEFLVGAPIENPANWSKVLPALNAVIKSSRALSVIVVSTGRDGISGTPFDREINAIYSRYLKEFVASRLAFVTVLVIRQGRIVGYSVNSSAGPVRIPNPPLPLPRTAQAPKAALTNQEPAASNAPTGLTPIPKSTNQTANPGGATAVSIPPLPQNSSISPSPTTNPVAQSVVEKSHEIKLVPATNPTASSTASIQTNAALISNTNLPVPSAAPPLPVRALTAPLPAPTQASNAMTASAPPTEPPTPTAGLSIRTSPPPSAPREFAAHVIAEKPKNHAVWIIISLAIAAGLVTVIVLRGRRPEPSLISRSINPPK